MSKRTKILIVLGSIAFQLALFEAFERFHLRFEDRYSRYLHRLSVLPITRIFDAAAFDTVQGSEAGEIRYDEDELSYRTVDIDYDRKRGTRFLFVGSMSMGYGTGVPAENTFPAAFGDALRSLRPDAEFEVINANRTGRSLELTLEELGQSGFRRVDPDVVILGGAPCARW